MKMWIVCLFACVLVGCQKAPAPTPTELDHGRLPVVIQEKHGDDIWIGLDALPGEEMPALAHIDKLPRLMFRSMDEGGLRRQLVLIGGEQVANLDEPEWYIHKAMVAEALTRFDARRQTNHWDRAMTHYGEAIELLKALLDKRPTEAVKKRLAEVRYYRSRCYEQLGKEAEAKADREAALAEPMVASAVKAYEDRLKMERKK